MTPFDPIALLVMLQTFYPNVTPDSLARAYRERPEYFAGGVLTGRFGDILHLHDGRDFLMIFAPDSPRAQWWVSGPGGTGGGPGGGGIPPVAGGPGGVSDGFFVLEPGPLVPLAIEGLPRPLPATEFQGLMGAALDELGATAALVDGAIRDLSAGDDQAALDAAYDDTIGRAAATIDADTIELEHLNIPELLEQSDGVGREVDDGEGDFPALPGGTDDPPSLDPGEPPRDADQPPEGGQPEA